MFIPSCQRTPARRKALRALRGAADAVVARWGRRGVATENGIGPARAERLERRTLLSVAATGRMGPDPYFTPPALAELAGLHVDYYYYAAPDGAGSGGKALSSGAVATGGRTPAADQLETEPNNTAATATPISVSATPNVITAALTTSDFDFYSFTLPARAGIYFDIDAAEIGLNTLDSDLRVFNAAGTTQLGANDDGRDFDTFALNETSPTGLGTDSALYMDLAAGSYVVRVGGFGGSTGSYQLKVYSDTSYTAGVPVFNSNPGASDTLFLDFDGHAATDLWGTYTIPAYDLNGNAAEWTPGERKAIENVWRVVADAFSPFNINVTTSYAGAISDGVALRQVIGNSDGSQFGYVNSPLGLSWPDSYAGFGDSDNTAFTFAASFAPIVGLAGASGEIMAKAIEMGNTTSHEFAHTLGLDHYGGTNAQVQAFMNSPDNGLNRERWSSGNTDSGIEPVVFQDDVAAIADAVNTFGYRADDHGNATAAATILSAVGNSYAASGVIAQTGDSDFFRFGGGGTTVLTVDVPEHLHHLDAELHLYHANGTLLASSEAANKLGTSLVFSLPAAGNYFVEIRSDGGAGEIGQYGLTINTTVNAGAGSIAGKVFSDVALNNAFEPAAGDAALAGVVVYLDANNNGALDAGSEISIASSATGDYAFTGLADGTHRVRQVVPAGYVSNVTQTINVAGGAAVSNLNFGDWPIVYNGNGSGDAGIVRLKAGDATKIQFVFTLGAAAAITYEAPHAIVPSLTFNGGAGADTLSVQSVPSAALPITFNGGDGADVLTLAAGAGATVSYVGGADAAVDSAAYNATNAAQAITVAATQVSSTGTGANGLTFAQLESLTIEALDGGDTINLVGVQAATGVIVNAGEGNDTIAVAQGDLDDVAGAVTVNGNGGTDQLVLNDSTSPIGDVYTITATTVSRDFFPGATYGTVEGLTLNAQAGGNTINVNGTAAATPVTVNGGDGNDLLVQNAATSAVVFNGGLDPADFDELRVAGGTYTFNADAKTTTANLTVRVTAAGAAVVFNASQHLAAIHVDAGLATLAAHGGRCIDAAAVSATAGRLDLKNNDLIVRGGAVGSFAGSAYTAITGLIDSGRGPSGAWNGNGIVTSVAGVNDSTTLGIARSSDALQIGASATATWQGHTVNGSAVLVKFTWGGDVNLDGKLNIDDYGQIDFSISNGASGWYNGDFNYDGKINIDDYGIIDFNVTAQSSIL